MKIFRVPVVLGGIAAAMAASGCNKSEDEPKNNIQVVKPDEVDLIDVNVKKAIDEKRKIVEKKEREFASEFMDWASSDLPNVLPHLYLISEKKEECLTARDISIKLTRRSEELIELTGNDFSIKKPNEDQLEAFNRLISMAQKGRDIILLSHVDRITSYGFTKKIEGYLKKENPELKGEKLKQEVEHLVEYFTEYQKTFKKMQWDYFTLRGEVAVLNDEAQKANEPLHQPVWGLSSRKLAELLRTFALRQ